MTATILFPVLMMCGGGAIYALASTKVAELGRLVFLAGAIALAFLLAGKAVHL